MCRQWQNAHWFWWGQDFTWEIPAPVNFRWMVCFQTTNANWKSSVLLKWVLLPPGSKLVFGVRQTSSLHAILQTMSFPDIWKLRGIYTWDRNYGNKKGRGEKRKGVLFTDMCVWWLADLANVPCVILLVHHITGSAEIKLLLSHMRSDRKTQVAPACLGTSVRRPSWTGLFASRCEMQKCPQGFGDINGRRCPQQGPVSCDLVWKEPTVPDSRYLS